MFVYLESEKGILWTVGHYNPQGEWIPEGDYDSPAEAGDRCAYLNGTVALLQNDPQFRALLHAVAERFPKS